MIVMIDFSSAVAYLHISKTIDACRVHLFDIVTQYKALFPDDDSILAGIHGNSGRRADGTLFCGWLNSKVRNKKCLVCMYGTLCAILTRCACIRFYLCCMSVVLFTINVKLLCFLWELKITLGKKKAFYFVLCVYKKKHTHVQFCTHKNIIVRNM